MDKSKMTSRGRTTIPTAVRDALQFRPGEKISYIVKAGRVAVTKGRSPPTTTVPVDPFSTFTEWDSDFDREADAGL